jgi:hypothetical protein
MPPVSSLHLAWLPVADINSVLTLQCPFACSVSTISASGKYACKSTDVNALGATIGMALLGPFFGHFISTHAFLCTDQAWLASVVDAAQDADPGEQGWVRAARCL